MALIDVLRSGVAIADSVTKSLQVTADGAGPKLGYQREIGTGPYGPTYAATVYLDALIDYKALTVRTRSGELTATRATITLLNVSQLVVATGGAGVGNNDIFILPDGDTGPILDISGFIDAGTGNPVATTVMLG